LIGLVVVKWYNRDAVVKLEAKRVDRIVD